MGSTKSGKKKKNWKCDSQELFETKLGHHYSREGSSGKGLNLKFILLHTCNLTRLSARNEIGKGFCL